ncbi:MAG: helicase C-terminal domain-containing protein [Dehalococcoidia bacterium]
MAASYVSIDLETTGLSAETDAIIEVAAVRFDDAGVKESLATLVNPHRPLPYRIQLLTGISEEELRDAPPFEVVAYDLERFIGDDAVVGQNVRFDLAFLAARGIYPPGPALDTWELASLLLPGLGEYNLRALAQHLGIEFPVRHRALPDAVAAKDVFLALRQRAKVLPLEVLSEINHITAAVANWPPGHFVRRVLEEKVAQAVVHSGAPAGAERPPRRQAVKPLVPNARRRTIDPQEVLAVLNAAREHPEALPNFEERQEQMAMALAVAEALNAGESLVVEAGTGVGKSLAYLIPTACCALANNARVVISTNTINLQEQLINKDIPALRRLLSATGGGDALAVAQLKGRRNYLCRRRFTAMRRAVGDRPDEVRMVVRLLLWLLQTETGDRSELNLRREEEGLWSRFSAQEGGCLAVPHYDGDGACFILRARQQAEAAHIVVVNHALLLSDMAAGGHVLPPYDVLIIDEAHHLEEEATRQLGFEAGQGDLTEYLDRVQRGGGAGGLATAVRQGLRGVGLALGPQSHIASVADALGQAAESARARLEPFFDSLRRFLRYHAQEAGDYDRRLRLTRAQRIQPDWAAVEASWDHLGLTLTAVAEGLSRLHTALEDAESHLPDAEDLLAEAAALMQTGQGLREGIGAAIEHDDANRVAWLAESRQGAITVAWAPLQVAELLQEQLYRDKRSVVLTSATLSTQGTFHYLKQRVGLEEARELLLGSPFDYRAAALLMLPRDMPEPTWAEYQERVEGAVVELCRAAGGRALVLFTSHAALRATHAGVRSALEREGISVLGQGIDGSPKQLLETLRSDPRTVLLGTASFWEGIDVSGENLSLLIMARLPFSVPTEPVFAARSELFDDPFTEYALPQAVLRFKQGFGRLIRSKSDRGVIAVLDQRLTSKAYGRAFLESLPPCTVREGALRELPALVARWLEG